MNSIVVVCGMNAEGTQVIGNPVLVYDGNDGVNHTVEGPSSITQRLLLYFRSCRRCGYGLQLVLRSRNIYGRTSRKS